MNTEIPLNLRNRSFPLLYLWCIISLANIFSSAYNIRSRMPGDHNHINVLITLMYYVKHERPCFTTFPKTSGKDKGKVYIRVKWPIRPELIPVSVA